MSEVLEMQNYLLHMPKEEANRLIGWLMIDLPRDPYFFDQIKDFRAHSALNFPERGDDREPQSSSCSSQKQAGDSINQLIP